MRTVWEAQHEPPLLGSLVETNDFLHGSAKIKQKKGRKDQHQYLIWRFCSSGQTNKVTDNIGELLSGSLRWIWDRTNSNWFISQHTLPALMDLVHRTGNDKDKCLTYRTIETKRLFWAHGFSQYLCCLMATHRQTQKRAFPLPFYHLKKREVIFQITGREIFLLNNKSNAVT